MVIVVVWVIGRSDVFHLVDTAAFVAALKGAFARYLIESQGKQIVWILASCGEIGRTTSQRTWCESAGQPVQPHCNSSPADLTIMGSSNVPVKDCHQHDYLIETWGVFRSPDIHAGSVQKCKLETTHQLDPKVGVSYQRCRHPASSQEFLNARDRLLVQDR